jgi:hypothetical protein
MAAAAETPVSLAVVALRRLEEPLETVAQATMVVPVALAARLTVLERLVATAATAAIAPMVEMVVSAEPQGSKD